MPEVVRQTRSHLVELFQQHEMHPRHDLGQNFLIDINLLEYVVASAELDEHDVVLEVGTGTGGLTAFLAERAGAVISVEIDPRVHALASEQLAEFTNAKLLLTDVLETKNELAPSVLIELQNALAAIPQSRLKLVANLPYAVATPVISNLLATELPITNMVVTVQWELAERMRGQPGTNDYGSLAVWLQSQCEVKTLKRLGPTVFWPRPKVDSAIVRVIPQPESRSALGNRGLFQEFLRKLFQQRRKVVRKAIQSACVPGTTTQQIEGVFQTVGLNGTERAEQIDIPTLVRLGRGLQDQGLQGTVIPQDNEHSADT